MLLNLEIITIWNHMLKNKKYAKTCKRVCRFEI